MNINLAKVTSLKPQSKPAFRNPIVEVTLLVIVCALFFWFLLSPKEDQNKLTKTELAKLESEQSQTANKLSKLKDLEKALKTHQEDVENLDRALPLDGKTLRVNLLIEALAKSVNVTISDVNVSGKGEIAGDKTLLKDIYAPSRSLQKLSGTVNAIGDFNKLQAFLFKIETSGRLIDIVDLSLDQGQDGNLNMKVSFNAYYFAP